MKSKRAQEFLGEHVTNMVIAVFSIIILLFLGMAIYNFFAAQKNDFEKAKTTLEKIVEKINLLSETNPSISHIIVNPKEWDVLGWTIANSPPASCLDKDCICICLLANSKDEANFLTVDTSAARKTCETSNKGSCLPISQSLKTNTLNKIKEPIELNFSLENGVVIITNLATDSTGSGSTSSTSTTTATKEPRQAGGKI